MDTSSVIEPFNTVSCLFVGTVMILMALLNGTVRKKDAEKRRNSKALFTAAAAVLLFYKSSYRLLAVCMPQQGYAGYSVFKWHTFGFFPFSFLGVFLRICVVVLGLYRLKYKDIGKAGVTSWRGGRGREPCCYAKVPRKNRGTLRIFAFHRSGVSTRCLIGQRSRRCGTWAG